MRNSSISRRIRTKPARFTATETVKSNSPMTSSAEIQLTTHMRRSSDRSHTHTHARRRTSRQFLSAVITRAPSSCYPTVSIPFANHADSLVFQVCPMQSVTARWTRRHPMSPSLSVARKATRRVTMTATPAHCSSTATRTIANSSKKSRERSLAYSHWKIFPSPWSFAWRRSIDMVHCRSTRSATSYD